LERFLHRSGRQGAPKTSKGQVNQSFHKKIGLPQDTEKSFSALERQRFIDHKKRILLLIVTKNWLFFAACFAVFFISISCDHQEMKPDENPPSRNRPSEIKKESSPAALTSEFTENQAVAGQVLIKFKVGTDVESINLIQQTFHLKPIKIVTEPNLYLMRILDGTPVEQKILALKEAQDVEYAEPNVMYSLD
jgi:hypothetical protein